MSDPYLAVSLTNIAGQYRHHAALVADGERPMATDALLIEFLGNGKYCLRQFGDRYGSNREAISALLDAAKMLNADAAH